MSKFNSTTKKSVAEIFVDRVVARVQSEGKLPWKKPWSAEFGNGARNALTGRYYNGLNVLCLPTDAYLTFKQVTELGGTIKKGAKSEIVVFWKQIEVKNQDQDADPDDDDTKKIPMMRYYNVFHVSDCDIPADSMKKLHLDCEIPTDDHIVPDADKMASYYLSRENIPMNWIGNKAYYRPSTDSITLPERHWFKTAAGLFGTWFHEMIHSTGAEKRLNRFGSEGAHAKFGDENYSKEELVAEIGACFLCTYCGIEMEEEETNSVAYLQSWLNALKNDPNMLVSAHSKARKAFEFVIDGFDGWTEPEESEEPEEDTVTIVSEPEPITEPDSDNIVVTTEGQPVEVKEQTIEQRIQAVRDLFAKNLITLDEYTRAIIQIAEENRRPFVEAEGTSVPSTPDYDGSYSNPDHGLWKERLEIRFEKTDDQAGIVKYDIDSYQELGTGVVTISDRPCRVDYFVNIIDDTDRIAGLLPAPKQDDPDSDLLKKILRDSERQNQIRPGIQDSYYIGKERMIQKIKDVTFDGSNWCFHSRYTTGGEHNCHIADAFLSYWKNSKPVAVTGVRKGKSKSGIFQDLAFALVKDHDKFFGSYYHHSYISDGGCIWWIDGKRKPLKSWEDRECIETVFNKCRTENNQFGGSYQRTERVADRITRGYYIDHDGHLKFAVKLENADTGRYEIIAENYYRSFEKCIFLMSEYKRMEPVAVEHIDNHGVAYQVGVIMPTRVSAENFYAIQ